MPADPTSISPRMKMSATMFEQAARAAQLWDGFLDALEQRAAQLGQMARAAAASEAISAQDTDDNRGNKKRSKRKGKRTEAETAATRDSEKEAEWVGEYRAIVLIQARVLSEELGRIAEAVDKYKEALQRNPAMSKLTLSCRIFLPVMIDVMTCAGCTSTESQMPLRMRIELEY